MLTKLENLDGLPVLTIDEGRSVGLLKRVLFDRDRRRVIGMSIAMDEQPRDERWLDLDRVVKIDDAAMFIDSDDAVRLDERETHRYADLLEERVGSTSNRLLPDLCYVHDADADGGAGETAA